MIVLNFSHPLTADHLAQVERLAGQPLAHVVDVPVHVDPDRDLAEQVAEIADAAGLSPVEWQALPLVVNLPGYAVAAGVLLAELHGRMGYFPAVLWIQSVAGSSPPRFQVAEVINLQAIRDNARTRR